MRVLSTPDSVTLWLSANDTYHWAIGIAPGPHGRWPCSTLANKRLVATFDQTGLVDLAINGGRGNQDCPADEFNAITSDFLRARLPQYHPAFFAAVGQFA